jgi:hypothetical protein
MCFLSFILSFFARHKDAFEALKNVAEIVAIIIGAIWTYYFFVIKREKYPRAKLEQNILWWPVTEGKIAVRVTVTIHNNGEVLLKLTNGYTYLQQVKPLLPETETFIKEGKDLVKVNETEIQWPMLGKQREHFKLGMMEIEPDENDEVNSDFVIDMPVESILVYSHIENEAKHGMSLVEKLASNGVGTGENNKTGGGIGWNISTLVELKK